LLDAIVVEEKNGVRLTAPPEVFTQQRFEMPTVEMESEVAYELNLIRIAPYGHVGRHEHCMAGIVTCSRSGSVQVDARLTVSTDLLQNHRNGGLARGRVMPHTPRRKMLNHVPDGDTVPPSAIAEHLQCPVRRTIVERRWLARRVQR
jgi:hypothetical protein